jgi:transporter family-2 protein
MAYIAMLLLAALAGVAFSMQGPLNAALSQHTGSATTASFLSFVVGLATATMIAGIATAFGRGGSLLPDGVPRYLYLAGCLGAFGVITMTIIVPRLGVTMAIAAMMAGQLGAALVTDRMGWFGTEASELSPRRLAGAALMMVAVWMMRR